MFVSPHRGVGGGGLPHLHRSHILSRGVPHLHPIILPLVTPVTGPRSLLGVPQSQVEGGGTPVLAGMGYPNQVRLGSPPPSQVRMGYHPARSGWYTPNQVRMGYTGQVRMGYPPQSGQDLVPLPARSGWGTSLTRTGVPPVRSEWGTPPATLEWGTTLPPARTGVLPRTCYAWTGYAAGGTPLAVSHRRTFLLCEYSYWFSF